MKIPCLVKNASYLPHRANPTDAGADLRSIEKVELETNSIKLLDTGVAVKIPVNYAGFIFNRSGQALQGITLVNGVGVIDSDYRGTIKVALKNTCSKTYTVEAGLRIALLEVMAIILCEFVDSWNDTPRGTGGFGSTGV